MPQNLTPLLGLQVGNWIGDAQTGLLSNELQVTLPGTLTAQVVDSALIEIPARIKTLAIVVDTAITSSAGQQGTVQLFAARSKFATLGTTGPPQTFPLTPYNGSSGAASSFPTTGPNACQLVGAAVNFSTSGTSIPIGVYWFTSTSPGNPSASPPTSMTELAQYYSTLGVEVKFPAAPTGGVYRVFFELSAL